MLYDLSRQPISTVFNYLNYSLSKASTNTKEKYLYALKKLYEFLSIFNLQLGKLDKEDVNNLMYFLKEKS
jgi:hypothetical protein